MPPRRTILNLFEGKHQKYDLAKSIDILAHLSTSVCITSYHMFSSHHSQLIFANYPFFPFCAASRKVSIEIGKNIRSFSRCVLASQ